jgi:hypothetical protein
VSAPFRLLQSELAALASALHDIEAGAKSADHLRETMLNLSTRIDVLTLRLESAKQALTNISERLDSITQAEAQREPFS